MEARPGLSIELHAPPISVPEAAQEADLAATGRLVFESVYTLERFVI